MVDKKGDQGFTLATISQPFDNHMSNQTIDAHQSTKDTDTFSKEEICTICDLSKSTLNNWILEEKAEENDYKTAKMGKKLFYFSYLKRMFTKAQREDLIDKLAQPTKGNPENTKDNQKTNQDLPNFDYSQLLTQQAEVIKTLQDQLKTKDGQMATKDEQILALTTALENAQKITSQQQSLSLQQGQLMLEDKKTKRGGLFGWFGGDTQKEEKQG